ncbi:TIGR03862 family flavoprotein [Thiomicrorhabdus arctica]|uniref:TIGR03862 family flavoprotein n=1 Tax=Thiomicrorhabdus arctica TaxID=131540 RepID=UPI000381AB5E|nr:TIGR03862 family flavoprotein [Thiomicrorhabdus arctica]
MCLIFIVNYSNSILPLDSIHKDELILSTTLPKRLPKIAIIGAGPAGLMAAQILAEAGYAPIVFDAMPSAARKFLQAGRGGLNLTHGEDFELFKTRYFEAQNLLTPALEKFTPTDLRAWAASFGFETFVGSSGKVYPLDKKAAPLLRAWLHQLKSQHTVFHMKHRWIGWPRSQTSAEGQWKEWLFDTPDGVKVFEFDAVILALGGASWPHLGSTGRWITPLSEKGISITPLQPANMGFDLFWSEVFKMKFAGTPLKNVQLSFTTEQGETLSQLGELMITEKGVEGSLIYTFSKLLREQLALHAPLTIHLDLFPHRALSHLSEQLSMPQGKQSLSSFWKRLGLTGVKASLLRDVLNKTELNQPGLVASTLKSLPLNLIAMRPIEEAISSAGGVGFANLDEHLMLKAMPGIFCAGEMLDWEAPTGGYLLTGVMAQGRQAAEGVLTFIQARDL